MMALDVPDLVRQRATSNGAAGQRWLDSLPKVVAALADQWGLTIGQSFSGGTAGYVTAAVDSAGTSCVLKVAMPLDMNDETDAFQRSVLAHQLAEGRGCATLLAVDASDASAPAMLLERLGPNLFELNYGVDRILETVAATLGAFWRPVPAEAGLPTGADKAVWLAEHIVTNWNRLDRPCSQAVIDRAVLYCDERAGAFDPSDAVLVHGDAHGWNTLSANDGPFKFVDPEGLVSERAHDLSVPMREYNEPLLAGNTARLTGQRAELLATLCEVDPEPVWQWGFIERVSTGLAAIREFEGDAGLAFLEVAERCL
jgi:streptomycin 6-kinase